jgi:glycosyltransferase involved in cell wall biosynthesis
MDTEHERYLGRLARGAGIEQSVRFEGQVAPDRVAKVLAGSDLFAFPSLCHEGMPLSLSQAVACGMPCLASEAPATREIFNGSGVEFVEFPNHAATWACKILKCLAAIEQGEAQVPGMRRWAEERFSEAVILESWREFYRRQIRLAGASGS